MDFARAEPRIRALMRDYFEVLHTQDMELFGRVFHPECVLYSAQSGELNVRPFAVYREVVRNRTSPAALGEKRREDILLFDQVSPTLAFVKPQLQMFGGIMQDYLNLAFVDEQWWVVAKMWEKVGDVSVQSADRQLTAGAI